MNTATRVCAYYAFYMSAVGRVRLHRRQTITGQMANKIKRNFY